jgi:hypothetical protein
MIPDYLLVRRTNLAPRSNILGTIHYIPRQPHKIRRPRTRSQQHIHDIVQRLPRLTNEIRTVEHTIRRIPSNLAGNCHNTPSRNCTIRIATRISPTRRLHNLRTLM